MRRTFFRSLSKASLTTLLSCFALSYLAPPLRAQDALKPLLSEEIRGVMERDGPEAAERRFHEIFPTEKDAWEVDIQGLAALGTGFMQKGDMAAAETVLTMVASITQETMAAGGLGLPTPPRSTASGSSRGTGNASASANASANASATATTSRGPDLGPARTDLARFVGEYGDDPMRRLWIAVGCTGHLVGGTTWGDASPWWLTSLGDTQFSYSDQWQSVEISFETESDGEAVAMQHNVEGLSGRLSRVPLREEWGKECITPPWG